MASLVTADLPILIVAAPLCIITKEINDAIDKKVDEPNLKPASDNDLQPIPGDPPQVITSPATPPNDPPDETKIENQVQEIRNSYNLRAILLSKSSWSRMRPERNDSAFPYTFFPDGTLQVKDFLRFTIWNGTWSIGGKISVGNPPTIYNNYLQVKLPDQYALSTWNEVTAVIDVSYEVIKLTNGELIAN